MRAKDIPDEAHFEGTLTALAHVGEHVAHEVSLWVTRATVQLGAQPRRGRASVVQRQGQEMSYLIGVGTSY